MKLALLLSAVVLALASTALAEPEPARVYLEQVVDTTQARSFAGVMSDEKECIDAAVDLNSWIMRTRGETGIHYGCGAKVAYPMPSMSEVQTLFLKRWTSDNKEQDIFVGGILTKFCQATVEAKTHSYKRARYPLRYKFECIPLPPQPQSTASDSNRQSASDPVPSRVLLEKINAETNEHDLFGTVHTQDECLYLANEMSVAYRQADEVSQHAGGRKMPYFFTCLTQGEAKRFPQPTTVQYTDYRLLMPVDTETNQRRSVATVNSSDKCSLLATIMNPSKNQPPRKTTYVCFALPSNS